MKLVCAWCAKEGKPALMAEKEPLSDPTETHGLCPDHRKQVEGELERHRTAAAALREQAESLRGASDKLRTKVDP